MVHAINEVKMNRQEQSCKSYTKKKNVNKVHGFCERIVWNNEVISKLNGIIALYLFTFIYYG